MHHVVHIFNYYSGFWGIYDIRNDRQNTSKAESAHILKYYSTIQVPNNYTVKFQSSWE